MVPPFNYLGGLYLKRKVPQQRTIRLGAGVTTCTLKFFSNSNLVTLGIPLQSEPQYILSHKY